MCRTYQELKINLPPETSDIKLSRLQKLKIRLGFPVYLGKYRRVGWTGDLPFYAYICPDHGLFVDYGHGYDNYIVCPKCLKEDAPIGGGEASRSDEGVRTVGDAVRAHSVSLPESPSNEDKEASP